MTEIRFYHLRSRTAEQALPGILQKTMDTGRRVVVRCNNEQAVAALNDYLWVFNPDSFIPHGSAKNGYAANQPVWLTAGNDNPNGADILILTGGAGNDGVEKFGLCCEMLDGRDEEAVTAARARWKEYKEKGFAVAYWQQNDKGGWEQKG